MQFDICLDSDVTYLAKINLLFMYFADNNYYDLSLINIFMIMNGCLKKLSKMAALIVK